MDNVLVGARHLALLGTPNSGKTALFNALTGSKQKVANYPGVTVERKSGVVFTPAGHTFTLVDLPGTYSLRARSPDEEVTRDVVLGRLANEKRPEALLCVADATNLRLALRLTLELKRLGMPVLVVLNMIDIAQRRGVEIDLERLAAELKTPVTTSAAVRRGGTEELIRRLDELAEQEVRPGTASEWTPPSTADLRAAQREADRILQLIVRTPPKPDTLTTRLDSVLLHPVAGLVVLLAVLFVMFQAVFIWAQPLMELISTGFDAIGAFVHATLPAGLLQSFIQDGIISGVGSVIVFLPRSSSCSCSSSCSKTSATWRGPPS
jgi:ferrous iron transport protein B